MANRRKLKSPCTLVVMIEKKHYKALREQAYRERKTLADIVREALGLYFKKRLAAKKAEK